jgi:hypothetical protein
MHPSLEVVCSRLDGLAKKIVANFSADNTLAENWGWNCAALTRHDLASMPQSIANKLREANPSEIDGELQKIIDSIPGKITIVENQNLPYFYNGHAVNAIPPFLTFIDWLNLTLQPLIGVQSIGWGTLDDPKAMPLQLTKRLRSISTQLDQLVPDKDEINKQIQLINEATAAAESLPTDLESLREARKKIDKHETDSATLLGKIETHLKNAESWSSFIEKKKEEADKLVAQCEEAYKITTSKGLAGAFDQRANRLNNSMWLWVVGLLAALGIGALIGSQRVDMLSAALKDKDPNMLIVWTNLVLSVFSIGAPIWFAWIATKQIAQRFKLAEDYAFKASVAKAYEGYRKEAARIDPLFESRLFNSALTRLEEPPLRVMEQHNYGSPWHELLNSSEFKKAIDTVPDLKDKLLELGRKKVTKVDESSIK